MWGWMIVNLPSDKLTPPWPFALASNNFQRLLLRKKKLLGFCARCYTSNLQHPSFLCSPSIVVFYAQSHAFQWWCWSILSSFWCLLVSTVPSFTTALACARTNMKPGIRPLEEDWHSFLETIILRFHVFVFLGVAKRFHWQGYVDGIEFFDAKFFGISNQEACNAVGPFAYRI